MTPQRWQQIEQLYDAALVRDEGERAAYLDEACGGDDSLRQEVVSLLLVYEKPGSFMDAPPHQVWAQLMAADRFGSQEVRHDDPSTVLTMQGGTTGDAHLAVETTHGINKRLRLVLFWLFFALMSIYAGTNGYLATAYFSTSSDPGWHLRLDGRISTFGSVSSADVSSLQDGDEIVELNGQEFKGFRQYYKLFEHLSPGSPYTVVIARDGQTQKVTLRAASRQLWIKAFLGLFFLFMPAIFLMTGFSVFILKQGNKQALLLALMLGMLWASWPPETIVMTDVPSWLAGLLVAVYLMGAGLLPVILHFFLVFPERSPILRRFPRFEYYHYLLFVLTAYPFAVIHAFVLATAPERLLDAYKEFYFLFILNIIITLAYLVAAVLSLAVNYRNANRLSRRKLRVVLLGSITGFLPGFSVSAVFFIFKPPITPLWALILMLAWSALLVVPLSLAYAIVRHRVIPVSLIIRRGVQYLLAKNGLRIILILLIMGLLVSIFADPQRTVLDILLHSSMYFYLLLIATLAFSLMFRQRLSEWADRKFFREAYNQEKILRELIDDIKPLDSPLEMSKHVGAQVERALHPDHMYVFNQEEDKRDLLLSYSSSGVTSPRLRIPAEFRLLRFMEHEPRAVEFPFQRNNNLPFVEKAWLAGLGTNLIVPMSSTNGRLAGLFLLGEKKSEVPYTATDRQLLEAVANQIAFIYENLQLKKHLASERKIKSEVLTRIENQGIDLLRECPKCGACFDSPFQLCPKDQSELTLSLPVERIIDERYRLDQLIGKGGMGAVYEAMDIRLQRKVAVKILIGSLFGDSEALRRFEREAQTAARLNHPNIIAVHDYGVLATQGAYLVMDLAHGATLGAIMKREYKLDPECAAEIFDQVLDGVGAAHQAGVIHRDLKPDNILITAGEKGQPLARVLDFGLAKLARPDDADLNGVTAATSPGTIMGTFGYMAPEQLTGTQADERSDLFAVGVMIVEALTGQRPFNGKTYHELLTAMQCGTFSLPDDSPDGRRLDHVLQRCLARDRTHRYASAAEMQLELIPVLRCYRSDARSDEPPHHWLLPHGTR
ncbi:MAG: protein kinase [Blastocatellia bacterium]